MADAVTAVLVGTANQDDDWFLRFSVAQPYFRWYA